MLRRVPLAQIANDRYNPHFVDPRHPVQQHTSLSPGVTEQMEGFQSSFDPAILEFDAQVRARNRSSRVSLRSRFDI